MFLLLIALLSGVSIGGIDSRGVEKIVGGTEVDIANFPYMLSLRLANTHACGAGIIDNWWAVTAAHCVLAAHGNLAKMSIRSGSSNKNKGGMLHNVTSTRVHEQFNVFNQDNDIAMLKVNPPFSFNKETQPVIVKGDDPDVDRSWGWIAGWGFTHESASTLPAQLMATAIPRVETGECIADYKHRDPVTKEQVCYGLRRGGKDACKGDSGSPLVNKDFVLLGLSSWGEGCAEANFPGVYTNALLYKEWITETTKRKGD